MAKAKDVKVHTCRKCGARSQYPAKAKPSEIVCQMCTGGTAATVVASDNGQGGDGR